MDASSQSSNSRKRKTYHRHSPHQTQQLELFFKEFPHPDEKQRLQLSKDLSLDPQQIKFWFQNKRTQKKTLNERADNNALRAENEKLRLENANIREALNNVTCLTCPGVLCQPQTLQTLMSENLRLREEATFLLQQERSTIAGKSPAAAADFENFSTTSGYYLPDGNPAWNRENNIAPQPQFSSTGFGETDRTAIIETAISAMDEVLELLRANEPVWTNSPSDGRNSLQRDSYDKLFPKPNHFKSANARMESSKDSGEVDIGGAQLVEVFLDPIKWMDMFPTIVTKATTLEVVDTSGMLPNSSIHLMYEKMHILSPLVSPREFFFVRYVQKIAPTTWVMVDVSYDFFKQLQDAAPTRSWKLPSGCMIEDNSNGKSFVTWIEHVEVDDKSLTHRLYRELVCHAYGAKRWVTTLQRMCQRLACSMEQATTPRHELEGVINSIEGRRNLMRLSHRMVKSLSQILSMSDRLDFPHLSELNNSGVRVSVRINNGPGQPNGLIVAAATSLWLPFSNQELFDFFNDEKQRPKWDILAAENPVNAIARIPTGSQHENCISIIQPFVPKENLLILQESSIDALGASLVYAPIDLPSVTSVLNGEDAEVLPSGYLISNDSSRKVKGCKGSGSLLTIAFQMLACHISKTQQLNMESVATVHSLISSTVQKIKVALGCPDLD